MTAAAPALSRTAPPIADPAVTPSSAIAAPIAADDSDEAYEGRAAAPGRSRPASATADPASRPSAPRIPGPGTNVFELRRPRVRPRRSGRGRDRDPDVLELHGRAARWSASRRRRGSVMSGIVAGTGRPPRTRRSSVQLLPRSRPGSRSATSGAGPRERQPRRLVALRRNTRRRGSWADRDRTRRRARGATRRRARPTRRRAAPRAGRPRRRARWRASGHRA